MLPKCKLKQVKEGESALRCHCYSEISILDGKKNTCIHFLLLFWGNTKKLPCQLRDIIYKDVLNLPGVSLLAGQAPNTSAWKCPGDVLGDAEEHQLYSEFLLNN